MKCPFCLHEDDKVIDSRSSNEGKSVRRRRECLKCKKRFTTYEYIEEVPLMVIKKDGRRESFDKEVKAQVVGELVMDSLHKLDEIAYVRFASVYRQFKDINQFMKELKDLLSKRG